MIAFALATVLVSASADATPDLRPRAVAYTAEAPIVQPALNGVAVTVECTAFRDGRVGDCAVLEETHPGLGFGAAAIALMTGAEVPPGPSEVRFARTLQFVP